MEDRSDVEHGKRVISVFVNERAGAAGRTGRAALGRALNDAGVEVELRAVEPHRLAAEVRRAAGRGVPIVGVAGGDGSVRAAAEVLAGSRTVLAPLPLGTLNHFARRLGLGALGRAARAMASGIAVPVPVGIVDDHIFLNTATFGIYADVVRRRDRWRRWLRKWPAAVVAAAVSLARHRPVQVVLEVEGIRLERATPLVWVGLGRNSFPFAHEASPSACEPVLEVVVVRASGRWATTAMLARLLGRLARRERPRSDSGLELFHARRLLLRGSSSIGVTLDGETYRWDPPLLIAAQRQALLVASVEAPVVGREPASR